MIASVRSGTSTHLLAGPEPDNLLGFLSILGLLRALDSNAPELQAHISWRGVPRAAQLSVNGDQDEQTLAEHVDRGIRRLASSYAFGEDRKDVRFTGTAFNSLLSEALLQKDEVRLALLAALSVDIDRPKAKDEMLPASPFVFMFGQGHQHFIERLVQIVNDAVPNSTGSTKIREALFRPWERSDQTPGFRWDPAEDQRYALRFRNPSKDGAATTEHGANRLAAIGLLSLTALPRVGRFAAIGATRLRGGWRFVWPIWSSPLSLAGIEAILVHPMLTRGSAEQLRILGVIEVMEARRIPNAKFMNVSRALARTMRGEPENKS